MATRAVYSFTGFPGNPACHLYLHHDGYPTGAAWRFATALRHNSKAPLFLEAFLSTQAATQAFADPAQAADAEYRYAVQLLSNNQFALEVQCWRRLLGCTRWHPRCGAMAMARFIERFLPGGFPG